MSASFVSGQIIPMFASEVIAILVIALLAMIGVVVWKLWTRARTPGTSAGGKTARAVDGETNPSEQLSAIALRVPAPDVREFLMEIARSIEETLPDSRGEASDSFVEEMLDRLDDLKAIVRKRTGDEAAAIGDFREVMVRVLADCGVELIHSDGWNPDLQRAIAKNPTAGTERPTITDFGSTGYFRHGTLRRKQEVVLAIPPPHPVNNNQP